jgi:cobalt-zinc-cadmium efflux system protein
MHNHHALSESRGAQRWLKFAMVITLALVITELVSGTIAHSLALISDGWHNLSDVPSLLFAWLAIYLEQRPPSQRKTFGYKRAGVLAAFVNALILVLVAAAICYDGYQRIIHPQHVASTVMIAVGAVALLINGIITYGMVHGRSDLNVRAIFLHNLGDALSNVAIIVGAVVLRLSGEKIIDPLLGFLIAGMILWSAIGIIEESVNILLESLPKGMTVGDVANTMLGVEGVREVHDIHVWSLNNRSHAIACHVRILDIPTSETEKIGERIRAILKNEFGITHCTIQFEHTHLPGDFHRYMPEPAPPRKETDSRSQ